MKKSGIKRKVIERGEENLSNQFKRKRYVRDSDRLMLLADEEKLVCAAAELKGLRDEMEDAHINAQVCRKDKHNTLRLFGVCDGHAGTACSDFLSKSLAPHVSKYLCGVDPQNAQKVAAGFLQAFAECEAEFEEGHENDMSGSTCCLLVYFYEPGVFYVANCGDSRAIVFDSLASAAATGKQVTQDHSPGLASERARIEKAGGFVTSYNAGTNMSIQIHRVNGILSVSRSFGDVFLRPRGVVETPDVFGPFVVGKEQNSAVLLACDGAFEYNTTEQLCAEVERVSQQCAQDSRAGKNRRRLVVGSDATDSLDAQQTLAVANAIREFAFEAGSQDNITSICLQFRA